MEKHFHNIRKTVITITELVTLSQFKKMLNENKPTEIFNSQYSKNIACWFITKYIGKTHVKYYAHAWANKTPVESTIEELYKDWSIQGLKYCFFTNSKKTKKIINKDGRSS